MKKIKHLLSALGLLALAALPAAAAQPPTTGYYSISYDTAKGTSTMQIAGQIRVGVSSMTLSSQKVLIDGTSGFITVTGGSVTASAFFGNGSGLTDVGDGALRGDVKIATDAAKAYTDSLRADVKSTTDTLRADFSAFVSTAGPAITLKYDKTGGAISGNVTLGAYDLSGAVGVFTGSVTAGSFIGDGTGLTGLNKFGYVCDTFTANGVTTGFTLSDTPTNVEALNIYVDGLHQMRGADYSYTQPTTLAMSTAPAANTYSFVACYSTGVVAGAGNLAFTISTQTFSGINTFSRDIVGNVTGSAGGISSYTAAGSYSWVAPTGVRSINLTLCAAGGGGGDGTGGTDQGGGGGGGGGVVGFSLGVVAGTTYQVKVGSGGTGGADGGGASSAGVSSYFIVGTSTIISASGGIGGTSTAGGAGGAVNVTGTVTAGGAGGTSEPGPGAFGVAGPAISGGGGGGSGYTTISVGGNGAGALACPAGTSHGTGDSHGSGGASPCCGFGVGGNGDGSTAATGGVGFAEITYQVGR
jgi:hypothetical protein